MSVRLTDEQLAFFRIHGYLVVPGFLTTHELAMYRTESETLVNHCYEQGDLVAHWGCVVEPLGCGYFPDSEITAGVRTDRAKYVALRTQLSPRALVQCTLDKFGTCAQQLLLLAHTQNAVDKTYLLNEQYIVKPPYAKAGFAWHQDILYFKPEERSNAVVSVWTPIDDVSLENGTVWVDPFPDPHRPGEYARASDESSKQGSVFAAELAAGSALFMDGRLRHCSTDNNSSRFRSVYMPQFSLGRIQRPNASEGAACTAFAIPVISEERGGSAQCL
ncbi:hypothetical protein LPJ59_002743 [Coemansia sp. RSA 2399]|nr:hypothetical protein LPJ59_002743 [Coemansia sp. RSA 2399]KAJ1898357.1 hypothetical protein LPJ81_004356 [Coemansia sp. IMI 209127]